MCRTPPPSAIQAALALGPAALATNAPTTVQGSPSLRLQRTYSVVLADGRTFQLVLPPPPTLRLLRSERSAVEAEAAAVRWIRDGFVSHFSFSSSVTGDGVRDAGGKDGDGVDLGLGGLGIGIDLPTFVHASIELPNPLEAPHLFLSPAVGTPLALALSQTRTPIAGSDRRGVDRQTGTLMRKLARLTSPTGRWGSVAAVVPLSLSRSHSQPGPGLGRSHSQGASSKTELITGSKPRPLSITSGSNGAESWSLAFHGLLEGILRDGEDMAVAVPYAAIRRNFRRLANVLDGVVVPRLVVVDGGDEVNVLVEQRASEGNKMDWAVSGLQDWSSSLFGDPLVASIFSDGPSEAFLEGFSGTSSTGLVAGALRVSRDVIDDLPGASVRLMLYQMYHALVCIVREFYRPRVDSSKRELAARKRLNEVLAKLADVADDPKRSHKRPSGEMSPAKRLKGDDGGRS